MHVAIDNANTNPYAPIRWGSFAAAIERAAEQRPAIEEAYRRDDIARRTRTKPELVFPMEKRIDSATFDALIDLNSILQPFRRVTTLLQAEAASAGSVVPLINMLFKVINSTTVERVIPPSGPTKPGVKQVVRVELLDQGVQQIRHAMYRDMIDRFHWQKLRSTFAIAALVDPRWKVSVCVCVRVHA